MDPTEELKDILERLSAIKERIEEQYKWIDDKSGTREELDISIHYLSTATEYIEGTIHEIRHIYFG